MLGKRNRAENRKRKTNGKKKETEQSPYKGVGDQ